MSDINVDISVSGVLIEVQGMANQFHRDPQNEEPGALVLIEQLEASRFRRKRLTYLILVLCSVVVLILLIAIGSHWI